MSPLRHVKAINPSIRSFCALAIFLLLQSKLSIYFHVIFVQYAVYCKKMSSYILLDYFPFLITLTCKWRKCIWHWREILSMTPASTDIHLSHLFRVGQRRREPVSRRQKIILQIPGRNKNSQEYKV